MEQMVRVARTLREAHGFRGYIHLKTIPEAEPGADRRGRPLRRPRVDQYRAADRARPERARAREARRRRSARRMGATAAAHRRDAKSASRSAPRFAPAGQSTQMIVGADARQRRDHPRHQRQRSMPSYGLRRDLLFGVQPDPRCQPRCCRCKPPPLMREHRLYQADWLMRFYGFRRDEITAGADRTACSISTSIRSSPGRCATASAFRSTSTPRAARCCCACRAWAPSAVDKLIVARRHRTLRLDDRRAARRLGAHGRGRSSSPPTHRPTRARRPAELRARLAPPPRAADAVRRDACIASALHAADSSTTSATPRAARSPPASRPSDVVWQVGGDRRSVRRRRRRRRRQAPQTFPCRPAFVELAQDVICHRDPERFALLYELLWRLRRRARAAAGRVRSAGASAAADAEVGAARHCTR